MLFPTKEAVVATESFVGPAKVLIRVGPAPVRIELVAHDGKQSQVSYARSGVTNEVINGTLVVTCGRRCPSVKVKNTGHAVAIGEGSRAVSGIDFTKEEIHPEYYVYHPAKTMRLVAPPKWRLGIGVPVVTVTVPVGNSFAIVSI